MNGKLVLFTDAYVATLAPATRVYRCGERVGRDDLPPPVACWQWGKLENGEWLLGEYDIEQSELPQIPGIVCQVVQVTRTGSGYIRVRWVGSYQEPSDSMFWPSPRGTMYAEYDFGPGTLAIT